MGERRNTGPPHLATASCSWMQQSTRASCSCIQQTTRSRAPSATIDPGARGVIFWNPQHLIGCREVLALALEEIHAHVFAPRTRPTGISSTCTSGSTRQPVVAVALSPLSLAVVALASCRSLRACSGRYVGYGLAQHALAVAGRLSRRSMRPKPQTPRPRISPAGPCQAPIRKPLSR